ncbi:MAG: helix-turn-helix transcriptional regulator [Clostridiales bacterium]|jgi:putative transcriptional regulator|nr:helix-turn-helix transcriptional regulator [Clostridiales bacterium]
MIYSYNRLWKKLIDKGMTKTEMRQQAGISTNILAKMGKGEPVAMESLAKICTALECGLDDIVEIQKEGE